MAPFIEEWLNLLVRWLHVIAAIMWIGDSFLFMWLDSHVSALRKPREGDAVGELWMTHSGAFYEVIKRKSLAKNELPPKLYWFKWESYTTWISGFLLLVIVYHLSGPGLLVDPAVMPLSRWEAAGISLCLLPLAFVVYEVLWAIIGDRKPVFAVVGLASIVGLAWGLTHVFSARGAFLQVGATLGTIMSANVFFRIIPSQRHMLAATEAGTPVDTRYGVRAKGRSIHNHYLTLPVLFCMLSNHFPSVYGASIPAVVLGLMFVLGVGVKFAMNKREQTPAWALAGTAAALVGVLALTRPPPFPSTEAYAGKPAVEYAAVQSVVKLRCVSCHAEHPANGMFNAPPAGVVLDNPDGIHAHADRMFVRAVATKTMPLANMTGMTDEERAILGAWYAQGAKIPEEAWNPPAKPRDMGPPPGQEQPVAQVVPAQATTEGDTPAARAQTYFKTICAGCHGADGKGNGPAAAALNPRPRDFTDAKWQASVTDQHIRDTIAKGGAAVGKSALMPPQTALAEDPAELDAMVKYVRSLGGKQEASK